MTYALEIRNLVKNFGSLEVTRDVSFGVNKGERLALIGPNGAGKTTIFNLISGVYPVTSGQILIQGTDITDVPSKERIAHGISRNFQNVRLMKHLTVVENLILGQHINASGVANMLQPFGMLRRHKWWKQAYEALEEARLIDYANETVDALPYGLRKRVDLVRALLADPKILLLDEPAAGLNPTETDELMRELKTVAQNGVTLLVVEHDMHFVRNLCERVVVLNFGEKVSEGTMAEVEKNPKVQAAYLGVEAEEQDNAA
jgi:branched-chain amino acid transport system ATP-binding protein